MLPRSPPLSSRHRAMKRITPAQLIWVMVVNGGHCTRKIPKGGREMRKGWIAGRDRKRGRETSIAAFVPWYHCCPQGGSVPGNWQWYNDARYCGVSVLGWWMSTVCQKHPVVCFFFSFLFLHKHKSVMLIIVTQGRSVWPVNPEAISLTLRVCCLICKC